MCSWDREPVTRAQVGHELSHPLARCVDGEAHIGLRVSIRNASKNEEVIFRGLARRDQLALLCLAGFESAPKTKTRRPATPARTSSLLSLVSVARLIGQPQAAQTEEVSWACCTVSRIIR